MMKKKKKDGDGIRRAEDYGASHHPPIAELGPWEDGPNFIPSSAWGVRSMYISILVRRQSVLFSSGGWLIYWMSLIDIVVVSSSAALLMAIDKKKISLNKIHLKMYRETMRAIIHFQHFCVSFRFGTVEGGRLPDRLWRRRQASQR